jgi:hypothetical protein
LARQRRRGQLRRLGRGWTARRHAGALSGWLEGDSVDIATLPKVADHRKRVAERPAVQKVLADEG